LNQQIYTELEEKRRALREHYSVRQGWCALCMEEYGKRLKKKKSQKLACSFVLTRANTNSIRNGSWREREQKINANSHRL
jgi:hypothetical protein